MKLAWFRTDTPRPTDPIDDTAALIAELRATRDIEVFTAANAHDFVSKHFRAPYDLTIYELDNTPAHAFIWPYLLRYSGVLLLRMPILHDSRAATLVREQRMRDYATEFAFNYGPTAGQPAERSQPHPGSWPMLRAVLLASRATVVSHVSVAELLRDQYPDAAVRVAGTGVSAAPRGSKRSAGSRGSDFACDVRGALDRPPRHHPPFDGARSRGRRLGRTCRRLVCGTSPAGCRCHPVIAMAVVRRATHAGSGRDGGRQTGGRS